MKSLKQKQVFLLRLRFVFEAVSLCAASWLQSVFIRDRVNTSCVCVCVWVHEDARGRDLAVWRRRPLCWPTFMRGLSALRAAGWLKEGEDQLGGFRREQKSMRGWKSCCRGSMWRRTGRKNKSQLQHILHVDNLTRRGSNLQHLITLNHIQGSIFEF